MSESNTSAEKTEEPTISADVSALLTKVRSHSRRLSRVKNLLKKIDGEEPRTEDYEIWLEVWQGLDGLDVAIDEIDEPRRALLERLEKPLNRLRVKARMKFLTRLDMLAAAAEVDIEKISESPLVLYVDPLTMEIDFQDGGARLLYGHEPIAEDLAIDPAQLLETRGQWIAEIDGRSLASEQFFDLLHDAYRWLLAADGKEQGERVELVDVLVPLSVLRADRKDLRKKGLDALEAFPPHLLAWQLAALRRDGLLEKDGLRLDLGAATGGSTRDKSNVLYIPVGAKSGQYYGSLRFTPS